MKKHLATLLGTLFILSGCDMFISRGGEGQPCFSESKDCSGDLICHEGRCVREVPDAGHDGGDEPTGDDGGSDAGDDGGTGGDDAGTGGDDGGGQDGGDGPVSPPTHIYRSVGPGSGEPMNGEQNGQPLLFTGSHANFTYDLDDMVGVGDVIQYDTDSNHIPDALVFIHERITARDFVVAKADGTPMDEVINSTTWGVLRAYTSLSDAITMYENQTINDSIENFDDIYATEDPRHLVTLNRVWNIACYADGPDVDPVDIQFWQTGESNYLRVFTPVVSSEAGIRQRHSGIWSETAYRLEVPIDQDYHSAIQIGSAYVHIDGLQISKIGDVSDRFAIGVEVHDSSHLRLSNSIIRGTNSEGQGIYVSGNAGSFRIWNTVIYNTAQTSGDAIWLGDGAHAHIYNVTIYDSYRGIYVEGNTTNLYTKNVIAAGNVGSGGFDFDSDADFGGRSSHNCSSDATAAGTGMVDSIIGASPEDLFEDSSADPPNLHLKSDSACNGAGINLTSDLEMGFSDDIDGDARPGTGAWDIGADENGQ